MTLLRKIVLGLALVALLVVAAVFGWRLYRQWTRPDMAKVGGTVLVYEVDESRWPEGKKPESYSAEQLAAKLKQRIDPADLYGVTVRPLNDTRVEISLPRRDGDHAEQVQQVKELIARTGALEFRILANTDDDKEGIDLAKAFFDSVSNNPAELEKLKAAATTGNPPPAPRPPDGKAFHTPLGEHAYSWVELGPAERHLYGLDNDAGKNAGPISFWKQMKEARENNKAVLHNSVGGAHPYRNNLFYSREVSNPDRLPEKDRDKKYEYFLLTREEGNDEAVTGDLMESAEPGEDTRGQRVVNFHFNGTGSEKQLAVNFRFNAQGTVRLADLTTKNKDRQMAIVLDDVIQSAPNIHAPITGGTGIITGNFTHEEVDRLVNILRSGALPATLKPVPVSETTVEPRR
jgi:preprotein translocase subunit SecD